MATVNLDLKELALKLIQSVLYITGSIFIVYNITAFTIDKHGSYYFRDPNQTWLAVGVGLYAVGLVIRNWKKL